MTAHKHAKMIKAKADNMDLIVFIQHDQTEWEECVINKNCIPSFDPDFNYFLCLPRHKEACLHWLNCGDVQYRHGTSQDWDDYGPIKVWSAGCIFMQEHVEIRIKPCKEKRWVVFNEDSEFRDVLILKTESAAIAMRDHEGYDCIEIEIEV